MSKRKTEVFYPDRIEGGRFLTRPVLQLMREMEGLQVEVCIRHKKWYTTPPQMRYYRGVVISMIGDKLREDGWTGPYGGPITDEEVHQTLSTMFLRFSVCVNPGTGESMDMKRSTTELTTREMSEYIDNIKKWAAQQFGRWVHNNDGTSEFKDFIIPEAGEQQVMHV